MKKHLTDHLALTLTIIFILIGILFYKDFLNTLQALDQIVTYNKKLGNVKGYQGYAFMFNAFFYVFLLLIGLIILANTIFPSTKKKQIFHSNVQIARDYKGYIQFQRAFTLFFLIDVYFISLNLPPLENSLMFLLPLYINLLSLIFNLILNSCYNNIRMVLLKKAEFEPSDKVRTYPKTKFFYQITVVLSVFLIIFTCYKTIQYHDYLQFPETLLVTETSSFDHPGLFYYKACYDYDSELSCQFGETLLDHYQISKIEIEMSITDYEQLLKNTDFLIFVNYKNHTYNIDESNYTILKGQTVLFTIPINDHLKGEQITKHDYFIIKFIHKDTKESITGFKSNHYDITYQIKKNQKSILR